MFNVGAGELLVILLIALIVLGPEKLPDTARKIGNVMGELRRMSSGFQEEMRSAMDDVTRPPLEAVKDEPVKDETADESEPKAKPDDPAA
jgi:Tat protein translocase TatB subunit